VCGWGWGRGAGVGGVGGMMGHSCWASEFGSGNGHNYVSNQSSNRCPVLEMSRLLCVEEAFGYRGVILIQVASVADSNKLWYNVNRSDLRSRRSFHSFLSSKCLVLSGER